MKNVRSQSSKYMRPDRAREFTVGRKYVRTDDWLYVLTSDGDELWYSRREERASDPPPGDVRARIEQRLQDIVPDFVPSVDANGDGVSDELLSNLEDLGYR